MYYNIPITTLGKLCHPVYCLSLSVPQFPHLSDGVLLGLEDVACEQALGSDLMHSTASMCDQLFLL